MKTFLPPLTNMIQALPDDIEADAKDSRDEVEPLLDEDATPEKE